MKYSKYKNRKTVYRGVKFDSEKEAQRYAELLALENAGIIQGLRTQVAFELIPAQKLPTPVRMPKGYLKRTERKTEYKADFVYVKDGKTVVEDTKGYETEVWKIKRKLMLEKYGIQVIQT